MGIMWYRKEKRLRRKCRRTGILEARHVDPRRVFDERGYMGTQRRRGLTRRGMDSHSMRHWFSSNQTELASQVSLVCVPDAVDREFWKLVGCLFELSGRLFKLPASGNKWSRIDVPPTKVPLIGSSVHKIDIVTGRVDAFQSGASGKGEREEAKCQRLEKGRSKWRRRKEC